jgi:hypothetical protein
MNENQDFPVPPPEAFNSGSAAQPQFSPPRREALQGRHDFSSFLQDFVTGREPQTTQWIRLASIVASQSFSCDVVVRVLQPNEKVASGTLPLDKLGTSIARKVGAKYMPGRLKRIDLSLEDFVYDPENPGAANEAYAFDKSFLPPNARVLVIGDIETPVTTFDAIRKAIEAELSNAEVKSFTLQWLEQHFQSAPLDDKYFLSNASPLSVLSQEANPHRPKKKVKPLRSEPELPQVEEVAGESSQVEVSPVEQPAVPVRNNQPAPRAPKEKRPVPGSRTEKRPIPVARERKAPATSRLALATIAMIVLAVGIVVLGSASGIFFKKTVGPSTAYVPDVVIEEPVEPPKVEAPVAEPVVAVRPKGPSGLVTVPSAGLRSGPSLDARPVKGSVKNRERVTILKRRPSRVGPDWVQIETQRGVVGWVWASVVKEERKPRTRQ